MSISTTDFDAAIVGGGAAGVFAAIKIAEFGLKPVIIEKNGVLLRKLGITGKGRCNFTNNCPPAEIIERVFDNPRFLFSAVNAFSPNDLIDYFENTLHIPTKTERGGRVFPASDKAMDVVNSLKDRVRALNIPVVADMITDLNYTGSNIKSLKNLRGSKGDYSAKNFLLTTGGLSYSKTGSTGDGFALAAKVGHTITAPRAALIALDSSPKPPPELESLTLKNVTATLFSDGKRIYSGDIPGEIGFDADGLTGPLALTASCFMKNPDAGYTLAIDLKPALSPEQLKRRAERELELYTDSITADILFRKLLPSQLVLFFLEQSGIKPEENARQIGDKRLCRALSLLKNLRFSVSNTRDVDGAIITAGGVSTKEIDPGTMRSKLIDNLFFAGEIIDVAAFTGGFNLQIAFSTAVAAAKGIAD